MILSFLFLAITHSNNNFIVLKGWKSKNYFFLDSRVIRYECVFCLKQEKAARIFLCMAPSQSKQIPSAKQGLSEMFFILNTENSALLLTYL